MSITQDQVEASFGGVKFGIVQTEGNAFDLPDEAQNLVVTDVNYGTSAIIQDLGQVTTQYQRTLIVPADQWAALQSKRGSIGTLTIGPGYSFSAVLRSLQGKVYPWGIRAQATFEV